MCELARMDKKRCLIKQINIEINQPFRPLSGNEIRVRDYFKISLTYTVTLLRAIR